MNIIRLPDKYIDKNFSKANFRKEKVKNKTALQKELGLEVNPNEDDDWYCKPTYRPEGI